MSIGNSQSSWGKLGSALPRIFIAIFIGVTISKPIEIGIFADDIDKVIDDKRQTDINKTKENYNLEINQNGKRYILKIKQLKDEIKDIKKNKETLTSEIKDFNNRKKILNKKIKEEIEGKGKTNKTGYGKEARIYDEDVKDLSTKILKKEEQKITITDEITNIRTSITKLYKNSKDDLDNLKEKEEQRIQEVTEKHATSFMSRLIVLDEIMKKHKIMEYANYFIMALFIFIEMSPVLMKLISQKGPYDYFVEQEYKLSKERYKEYEKIKKKEYASQYTLKEKFYELSDEIIAKLIPQWEEELNEFYSNVIKEDKDGIINNFRIFLRDLHPSHMSTFSTAKKHKGFVLNGIVPYSFILITIVGSVVYLNNQDYDIKIMMEVINTMLSITVTSILLLYTFIKFMHTGILDIQAFKGL